MEKEYFKGRGSQIKSTNKFLKQAYVQDYPESLDEPLITSPKTQVFYEQPKSIVNKVTSPDVGMMYSINPYQGCEHGCIYCYARNTHEYWGFSAGLDFESKIIVKKNAPGLLEKYINHPTWEPVPISVSGNTDCYQPLERKFGITRKLLEVFNRYRHPVGMITKNGLIQRDLDLLQELAKDNLIHVYISLTTLDETLRSKMEPRTTSAQKRLQTIKTLSEAGIPVGVMCAPIIPGLNHHELPDLLRAAADHGAQAAGMTVVRLNGAIGEIFKDWLEKNFEDRYDKVLNQIYSLHDGQLNDSKFGRRISGEGNLANVIHQLFRISKNRFFKNRRLPPINIHSFRKGGTLSLF